MSHIRNTNIMPAVSQLAFKKLCQLEIFPTPGKPGGGRQAPSSKPQATKFLRRIYEAGGSARAELEPIR